MKRERRKFTNEFKAEVALEAIKEKLTMVELAMKYKVNPVQIKACIILPSCCEVVGFGWTKLV
jgi:transposase-like protein